MEDYSDSHMMRPWLDDFGGVIPPTNPLLFDFTSSLQHTVVMAEDLGYRVLRKTVPEDQALKLAETIPGAIQPSETLEKVLAYPMTPAAIQLFYEFIKVSIIRYLYINLI
jgi:hypothetical protein